MRETAFQNKKMLDNYLSSIEDKEGTIQLLREEIESLQSVIKDLKAKKQKENQTLTYMTTATKED